ncbi:hypothetical protein LEMA_P103730.1 [Plenodomus lingam JN3]|uniref:DUF7143 domain-containing protein n=1 Tax=Leptosphaeria maculans (strain JN3 / isolate v23.1.3 / race Av1-4-5-6-7-8) TaxID=985895 RepID=E5A0U6_LEPMJ|nr:hypothetical protein LEMA_P103730.1 [Plenodomus lingam JN3]CBX97242.1 hypothetical protein LEMA_P103730.1 [Plenodomus lingam JN3]
MAPAITTTTTTTLALTALLTLTTALPAPSLLPRQSNNNAPCFLPGSNPLPAEVSAIATTLASSITCSSTRTTLSGVPDVTSGSISFSSIDFSQAEGNGQSPLAFALETFATPEPLADADLQTFEDELDVYLATEAGVRSVGGALAIKVPKFFLQMQVSRIQTAQGNPPAAPGLQVDHLRDKVIKNAAGEDQALLDQVVALAAQLD